MFLPSGVNGPNQAHCQALVSLSCIENYNVRTYTITLYWYYYDVFVFPFALVISSAPWCPFCLVLLRVLSDPADQFESIFLFCTCVLASWTVIYCVILLWSNHYFSVRLKNPKVLFYFIFSLTSVLHWLKISRLYVAFDSNLLQEWLFLLF